MKFFTPFLLKVKPKEWELFSGKNKTKTKKMNEKSHKLFSISKVLTV